MRSSFPGDTLNYDGDPFRWAKVVLALAIAALVCGSILTCGRRSMKDIDREYREWDSSWRAKANTLPVAPPDTTRQPLSPILP